MNNEPVVLFGLGGKYKYEKQQNPSLFEGLYVIAYSDNNESLWGDTVDGYKVIAPSEIVKTKYNRVVVLSNHYQKIVEQLVLRGIPENKIIHWDEFVIGDKHSYTLYPCKSNEKQKKSCLLISTELAFNGGTLALVNAGIALQAINYRVVICGPKASREIINYISIKGMDLIIAPAIEYPNAEEKKWIEKFDHIIVNVFQMIETACFISTFSPVLWWIHENSAKYSDIYPIYRSIHYKCKIDDRDNLLVCPVTKRADEVFKQYYPLVETKVVSLGIEDFYGGRKCKRKGKIRAAILGTIDVRKNQKIAFDLTDDFKEKMEIWIVGKSDGSEYANAVVASAKGKENCRIIDEISYQDIKKIYESVDIILCPSLEETLSMTIVEGMMNKKICITSDATGVADYLTDGVDGFIFKSGDVEDLKQKLNYVIENWGELDSVREAARENYLRNFSLESFGKRLAELL